MTFKAKKAASNDTDEVVTATVWMCGAEAENPGLAAISSCITINEIQALLKCTKQYT